VKNAEKPAVFSAKKREKTVYKTYPNTEVRVYRTALNSTGSRYRAYTIGYLPYRTENGIGPFTRKSETQIFDLGSITVFFFYNFVPLVSVTVHIAIFGPLITEEPGPIV
jgi:hypothetical protein